MGSGYGLHEQVEVRSGYGLFMSRWRWGVVMVFMSR